MIRSLDHKFNSHATLFSFVVAILFFRILSYFSFSDDILFTQIFKASLRLALTCTLLIIGVLQTPSKNKIILNYLKPLPFLLYVGYLLLGLFSLLWTTSFSYSAIQWLMDFEAFCFAFLFIRLLSIYKHYYNSKIFNFINVIAFSLIPIAIVFTIGMLIDPENYYRLTHGGQVARLGGYIINPNELGLLMVIGISCWLYKLSENQTSKIGSLLVIMFLTWLLILTGSRSAFVAMILVLSVYAILLQSKIFKVFLITVIILMIPIVGVGIFIKQNNIEEVLSLTGRIPFWKDLLTYNFSKEPLLGFGYMRIDYTDKFDSLNAYAGSMTHNTFLQVLLGLGLTGLLLVIIQISTFLHALYYLPNKSQRNFIMILFIPILINSLTEFGIFGPTNYGVIFYLMLVFSVSMETIEVSLRKKGSVIPNATTSSISFRPMPTA